MSLEDLTPSNRFELALSGDMTAEEASNRIEKILAGADIEPADRLEYFLKLRVSGGGGGGGDDSPFTFKYIKDYTFVEGDSGAATFSGAANFDTGVVIDTTGLFGVLLIATQTIVGENGRTGEGTIMRTATSLTWRDQYTLTGFDDTSGGIYINELGHLITTFQWQYLWCGPYHIFEVREV